jgi:hypothetical protein
VVLLEKSCQSSGVSDRNNSSGDGRRSATVFTSHAWNYTGKYNFYLLLIYNVIPLMCIIIACWQCFGNGICTAHT